MLHTATRDRRPHDSAGSRRTLAVAAAVAALIAVAAPLAAPSAAAAASTATATFTTPGQSEFTVPLGVTSISVTAIGGAGGSCTGNAGGEGASASATFPVTPGEQLLVGVAGPGSNCSVFASIPGGIGGGGASGPGFAASGGGASIVGLPQLSPGYTTELIVAAGGGGAGNGGSPGGGADAPGGARPLSLPQGAAAARRARRRGRRDRLGRLLGQRPARRPGRGRRGWRQQRALWLEAAAVAASTAAGAARAPDRRRPPAEAADRASWRPTR